METALKRVVLCVGDSWKRVISSRCIHEGDEREEGDAHRYGNIMRVDVWSGH